MSSPWNRGKFNADTTSGMRPSGCVFRLRLHTSPRRPRCNERRALFFVATQSQGNKRIKDMRNLCGKLSTVIFYIMWIQCFVAYISSICQTCKADKIFKMICMILIPPFSQLYYFFESWIKFGLSHSFCVSVLLIVALALMGVVALVCDNILKKPILNVLMAIVLAVLTLVSYVSVFKWGAEARYEKRQEGQIKSVLGIKFGDKPNKYFRKINTSTICDTYEFTPSASFRNYDHYCVNVSKNKKRIFSIRAQKDFESADESEKEVTILKSVLMEKYGVNFRGTEKGYIAVNGNDESAQLLIIASGRDTEGMHIVIFSIIDGREAAGASAEAGLSKESLLRDGNVL